MSEDPERWARAQRARDQLADRLLHHPDVSLIDIGRDPNDASDSKRIVLRVHLRHAAAADALDLPLEIDSIPITMIIADYRLE